MGAPAADDAPREVAPDAFRATVGTFATGVVVVATRLEGTLHGMTANAFASVSLDPPLVLVCIDRGAGMHRLLPRSRRFAVTVLAAHQEELAVWFASPRRPGGHDQFDGVHWQPAPVTASPVLSEGLAYLDCVLHDVHDGGDHSIFLGRVVDAGHLRDAAPLLFYRGRYDRLEA